MKASLCTYTGRQFYPMSPRLQDICLEDIAHGLSCMPRFNGHTREFYSVAQHSTLVTLICPLELQPYAILHDASEAYLHDIPTPIKQYLPEYIDAERQLQSLIYTRFGLDPAGARAIKAYDAQALEIERHYLMPTVAWWPREKENPGDPFVKIVPLSPAQAKTTFKRVFMSVFSNRLFAESDS